MDRKQSALRIAMGLYFVFAAAVQINDPDAILWGSFYAIAAFVTFFAAWRTPPRWG